MTSPLQTLYAAWVEPDTQARRRFPVVRLDRGADAEGAPWMTLRYVAGVQEALERGFQLLDGMEDVETEYRMRGTFFLVRQRILRPSRPDYADWLASLGWPQGFDTEADPFRVLVRSGGRNAIDRLEFLAPIPLGGDRWRFEFFVRYVRGNPELAPLLAAGTPPVAPLRIEREPENPVDPNTLAVRDAEGRTVGYVPAYYSAALHAAHSHPEEVELLALNPAPESSAYRLLVACEAELPEGWTIASSNPELQLLTRSE